MDPPPPPPPPPPTTDSTTDSSTEALTNTTNTVGGGGKLRLMCSYGGHIIPRPHDKSLCYVGGETRIVVIDRNSSLTDLLSRLSKTLINGRKFLLKYQLPNEDLDSLITITTDEDLVNMIDEYDHLVSLSSSGSAKTGRIRLFLFPERSDGPASTGPCGTGLVGVGGDDWFVNSLNGLDIRRGFSDPISVNCLLGLDNGVDNSGGGGVEVKKVGNVEVQSVPDSPIVETNSSFGSTNSTPSMANLAPIRVHVEENGVRVSEAKVGVVGGIEEQFGQLGIGVNNNKQVDDGFVALSSPLAPVVGPPVTGLPVPSGGMVGNGSELVQQTVGHPVNSVQAQQKQMGGCGGELASPDSVASDNSLSNAINRQIPVTYQDSVTQSSTGSNRPPPNMIDLNGHIQVLDSGYAYTPQYDPQQQQQQLFHYQQQQPLQPQQQQQQPLLPQQQQPTHHHPPAGAVPLSTFYQMYPPQQPHHLHPNQYQVYYVPAGQAPGYHFPVQQQPPNVGESVSAIPSSHPQTPQNPTLITTSSVYKQTQSVPNLKPEMSGIHRVATTAGLQLVQFPPNQLQSQSQPQPQPQLQQQFMGYSQIHHHQSQSIAPNSPANGAYAYEFVDAAHPQMYYTQPAVPPLAAQYQAVTSGANMVLPDCSSPNENDNLKQQIRSSQPI